MMLTDKEIIELWRSRSGPVYVKQDFDADLSFPCIRGIELELSDKGESFISSVTFADPNGLSFIKVSPKRLYTGELRKKYTDYFSQ